MDVLSVDVCGIRRKTSRVPPWSEEDRTRIGLLLKRLRDAEMPELNQEDVARKLGCSIGTVQAIEYNKYRVNRDTIEKYAALFGKTTQQLLHPETMAIAPSDPRYADLNHEHLAIARRYMRAVDVVRAGVRVLLSDNDAIAETYAEIVVGLRRASDTTRNPESFTLGLQILIDHPNLVQGLAYRLQDNPEFAAILLDFIKAPDKGKS